MKVSFTELNSGYKGEKRVSRTNAKGRSKAIIALTLVAVFVVTFILSSVGIIPVDALLLRAKVSISGNGDRFPIPVSSDSILFTDIIGDNLIIVTTENIVIYSNNGKQLCNKTHNFTKPGLSVNEGKAVVFDRGGKGFYLFNSEKVIYEGTADNIIISAEYGNNGNYALGTKGNGATSAFVVYDKHHKKIFQWNCAHEHIVSIALSDNGRYAGVVVLGAENGEIVSTVKYFGFDYKEALNTQKIVGASPFDLQFTELNTLTLLTDNGAYVINRKADKYEKVSTYYPSEFNSCDFSSKGMYIVTLAKYGSENVFEINLFSKSGKLKTTVSVDFELKSTRISDRYIFALGENKIMVYNLSGANVSEIKFKGEAYSLLPTDDFIFITSLDKITRCFSYGDAIIELNA